MNEGLGMNKCLRVIVAGIVLFTFAGFSQGGVAQDQEAWGSVAGVIQAVETERGSLIVDGRRFQLANEVSFDGSDISAERALRMLSEGDEIRLLGVESSYDQVTRIRTRLH